MHQREIWKNFRWTPEGWDCTCPASHLRHLSCSLSAAASQTRMLLDVRLQSQQTSTSRNIVIKVLWKIIQMTFVCERVCVSARVCVYFCVCEDVFIIQQSVSSQHAVAGPLSPSNWCPATHYRVGCGIDINLYPFNSSWCLRRTLGTHKWITTLTFCHYTRFFNGTWSINNDLN